MTPQPKQLQTEDTQETPEETPDDALPDYLQEVDFQMSEAGIKAVGELQEINASNPELVDDAITKLVASNGEAVNESSFIESIARAAGMDKEATTEMVTNSITEYRSAAAAVITKQVGIPGEAFLDFIREHKPQVADRMVYSQMAGDFSPHIAAANDYLTNLPKYDREAALSADLGEGFKAVEVNGQVVVKAPNGKTYTWNDAMKKFRNV